MSRLEGKVFIKGWKESPSETSPSVHSYLSHATLLYSKGDNSGINEGYATILVVIGW